MKHMQFLCLIPEITTYLAGADDIHPVFVIRFDSHMNAAGFVHTVQHQ